MVTGELLDFLRAQLASGVAASELERMLVEEGGWDKSDVEEGLLKAGYQTSTPTAPPESFQSAAAPQLRVTSMDVESTPISALNPILETEGQLSASDASEPYVLEEVAPSTLSGTRQRETSETPKSNDDFLGIFAASSPVTPLPEMPSEVSLSGTPEEGAVIRVDSGRQPIRTLPAQTTEQKRTLPALNLMDMLASVSAPIPGEDKTAQPPQDARSPMVQFDLSRIKQSAIQEQEVAGPKQIGVGQTVTPSPVGLSREAPPPITASNPLNDKPIETHSVAELWMARGKSKAPPAQNEGEEKTLRAALSSRRTMTSDILLRGKGAAIQGLPALLPPVEENPMPQYASRHVVEAAKVEEKKVINKGPVLSVADELARKNKIKRIIGIAGGALAGVALVAGAAVLFVSLRGPDASTLLASTMSQFFAVPSFAYSGTASSDFLLTSTSGGETRSGAVKFVLGYGGELNNDKYGYGNGNHRLKWSGGLSSGNFSWSTDIESDLRMIGTDLYFHVLSFPPQSDIDPDLFKTYWIKVDIAEIVKELALDVVPGSDDYGGIAGTESTNFNAIIAKDMPFTGGEKVGSESIGGIPVTHITLKSDPEKMYLLATDLYKKYMGKTFVLSADGKVRFTNALEKLKVEIWVDEKTKTLVQVKVSGDLDDDIGDIHAKGPLALSFLFSRYALPITVTVPGPYLSLDELHTRMNDYKKSQEVRSRDAAKINSLGEIQHALDGYMSAKGRFPTTLSELRQNDILSTSTIPDDLLRSYLYAPYVKEGDFSKADKCVPKSKICATYHIGVDLEDMNDPALQNDADQNSDVHGADTAGCSLEREKACYDIVFTPHPAVSATTSQDHP